MTGSIAYRHEHGDGHGDDMAVRSFGKGLRLSKLKIVRELVVEGDTVLVDVGGEFTALAGRSMVLWEPGHWSVIARNVSPVFMLLICNFNLR